MKKAVILINLGTPDSPSVRDVRVYLREFLMDKRVIDINPVGRFFLINAIIAPFRSVESAKGYAQLWTENGSPLKFYGERARDLLQKELDPSYTVFLAMRYQKPSIASVFEDVRKGGFGEVTVIPLYPQYASASTGSTTEEVMRVMRDWQVIPHVRIIEQFFEHPMFIHAFVERGREFLDKNAYDHILFSYHGLPERQIRKASVSGYCQLGDKCCSVLHDKNRYCYRAQCFATTRLLVKGLGLKEGTYSTSFQSRLGKDPWIKPYTDEVIKGLAARGVKRLLVFSPAFVADCLETTVEIDSEYKHVFLGAGGERLDMVPSLNDHPAWIRCLKTMVENCSAAARP